MKLHSMKPYWFTQEGISKVEKLKNAKYMGPWCTRNSGGFWNEEPVDIFYVENPDTSLGHSNYFGLFRRDNNVFITNGLSAFSEPMWGKLTESGDVVVSRYRHDYIMHEGVMVDGGRDYFKNGITGETVKVTVDGPDFLFEIQECDDR